MFVSKTITIKFYNLYVFNDMSIIILKYNLIHLIILNIIIHTMIKLFILKIKRRKLEFEIIIINISNSIQE